MTWMYMQNKNKPGSCILHRVLVKQVLYRVGQSKEELGQRKEEAFWPGVAGKTFQKADEEMGVPGGSDTEKKWKNNPLPIRARKMHERDLSTFVSLLSSATLCAVEFAPCHIFSQDFQD